MKELTELDNKAWELFKKSWTIHTVVKNIYFFAHHRDGFPYNKYYEKALLEIRKNKINQIIEKI